jgi:choline dehydrogenase-like flavoprotein
MGSALTTISLVVLSWIIRAVGSFCVQGSEQLEKRFVPRDSRGMLSDQTDEFGMRRSRIDWNIHKDGSRNMRRMAELLTQQLPRMQFPAPVLENWVLDGAGLPSSLPEAAHPTGTTRMSVDRVKGVVDADCRVNGFESLYVAGSSIFPTVGHCNPTQMIGALALRFADHLKLGAQQ